MTLKLPLLGAITPYRSSARTCSTRAANGTVTGGQLNGAIQNSDVKNVLIPASRRADREDPGDAARRRAMELLAIFDNGGKSDAACAWTARARSRRQLRRKGDNKIDICEVATAA